MTIKNATWIAACCFALPMGAQAAALHSAAAGGIPGQYIVVLKENGTQAMSSSARAEAATARIQSVKARTAVQSKHEYRQVLAGFSAQLSPGQLKQLLQDPDVDYIVQNGIAQSTAVQSPTLSWGLDRIDFPNLPTDGRYEYNSTGSGVHAYIVDSGINTTHTDFGGRIGNGIDYYASGNGSCNGHGTHVAGTVGGSAYGVAKGVTLHNVRVLGCDGSGDWATVIAGLDWVRNNRILPAVVNMSLGGGANAAVDQAVANLVNSGVPVVVAAGNSGLDACQFSPARAPAAITVGATTASDARAGFSNHGGCVDIYAPGQDITAPWVGSNTAIATISGTSMAAPHVAGIVARYLEKSPTSTPATVAQYLTSNARSLNIDKGAVRFLTYVERQACTPGVWTAEKGNFWLVNSSLVRTWANNLYGAGTATVGASTPNNRIVSLQLQLSGRGGVGVGTTVCNTATLNTVANFVPADYKMVACDAYGNCRTSNTVGVYQ